MKTKHICYINLPWQPMVHDEQCDSPVLRESRMQREVVLFLTQRRFFLFLEAIGPKGCTTRKPILTKRRARTNSREKTDRKKRGTRQSEPTPNMSCFRWEEEGPNDIGERERKRGRKCGRKGGWRGGKGEGMSRAEGDGVVDWQENEVAEERRNGRGISYSFILQRPRELWAPTPLSLSLHSKCVQCRPINEFIIRCSSSTLPIRPEKNTILWEESRRFHFRYGKSLNLFS